MKKHLKYWTSFCWLKLKWTQSTHSGCVMLIKTCPTVEWLARGYITTMIGKNLRNEWKHVLNLVERLKNWASRWNTYLNWQSHLGQPITLWCNIWLTWKWCETWLTWQKEVRHMKHLAMWWDTWLTWKNEVRHMTHLREWGETHDSPDRMRWDTWLTWQNEVRHDLPARI